jgi:5'-AMP-activated protein kinase catalytic alpha subunit
LKPENVLIDRKLNLKITDFGYAKNEEELKDGMTRTNLGSEGYKAPEFYLRKPYSPATTDLFASGVILFILMTGFPPFRSAKETDPWYRLIWNQRFDIFWPAIEKNVRPGTVLSPSFKSLIEGLLCKDPATRLTMS